MAVLKKHWVPVVAPALFKHEHLGDSFVLETETLAGRGISVNLMNLTGDMKKQNLSISFRITNVKEGKAHTRTTAIHMQPGSLKRLVRRGRTKIDDSFAITLKHGHVARIKPVVITKNVATNASATALRKRLREVLSGLSGDVSFETMVHDIVNFRLQRHLRDQLDSVLPVRSVDIRALELLPKYALEPEQEVGESTYLPQAPVAQADDESAERS